MPIRKTLQKRPTAHIHPDIIHHLEHGEWPEHPSLDAFERFLLDDSQLRKLWLSVRDELLREWVKSQPGTRPHAWWRYDAPEPRKRLGGVGDVYYDFFAEVPIYDFGIPRRFVSPWDVAYYNGRSRDCNGKIVTCEGIVTGYKEGDFTGKAVDLDDPPIYESEALYLKRLGLLSEDELKALRDKREAREPEAV